MPNITLSISEDVHKKMKKHSEIRWSELVRKTIAKKIETLDLVEKIAQKSKLTEKDVDEISHKIKSEIRKRFE
ncbi:MAG: hypothetical protein AABW58_02095 [Nanoarchaeota archaeon]